MERKKDEDKVNHYVQISHDLYTFINPHKDAIGTGLYYLSLGIRDEDEDELSKDLEINTKEKPKTLRVNLSNKAQEALDELIRLGYSKKQAFVMAIRYLQAKPKTLMRVKI